MEMTPQERAEKILEMVGYHKSDVRISPTIYPIWLESIAAQIEEAEREALGQHPLLPCWCADEVRYVAELCRGCHCRKGYEWETDTIENLKIKSYSKGFSAAKEKAKGVVNSHKHVVPKGVCHCADQIADRISKMEPGK